MIRNFTLLCFFAIALPVHGQDPPVHSLGALKLEFDIKRAELSAPLDELDEKYAEQLDQLLDQVAQAGNLEKSVILKAEIEGFRAGKSEPADDNFSELKRLQTIYASEHAKRLAAVSGKLTELISAQQAKVLALQTQLTKEKKIDEAVKVREEIERLEGLAKTISLQTTASPDDTGTGNSFRIGSPVELLTDKSAANQLAVVKVENGKWNTLTAGALSFTDADYKWREVPESLVDLQFSMGGKHSHTLKFAVEKPGFVFIAVSPRFTEKSGSGGSWEAEALDLKGLKSSGWRHIRQFDGLTNESSGSDSWMVFYKVCAAGEVHSIRTEKYIAPVLLVKGESQ